MLRDSSKCLILTIRIKIGVDQEWFVVITLGTRCHKIFQLSNPWRWPGKFIIERLIVGVWCWFVPGRGRRRRGRRRWRYHNRVYFTRWNIFLGKSDNPIVLIYKVFEMKIIVWCWWHWWCWEWLNGEWRRCGRGGCYKRVQRN
jgi:hypothetical protein